MSTTSLNGKEIYYEVIGDGFPLVIINGITENIDSWQVIANNLSQHFQLILFDYRHLNKNPELIPADMDIHYLADDVLALMNHLDIEEAHILGYGMGGFVAQDFVINFPDRVKKLILEGTSSSLSFRNKKLLQSFLKLFKQNIDKEIWIRQFLYWMYSPRYYKNIEYVEALISFKAQDPNFVTAELFEAQVNACLTFNSLKSLSKIHAETLIILGEEDILYHPTEADILYQGIIHASYPLYIQECGHAVHIEHPKQFVHAILGFLYRYDR